METNGSAVKEAKAKIGRILAGDKKKQLWAKIVILLAAGILCMTFFADWQTHSGTSGTQTSSGAKATESDGDTAAMLERKIASLVAALPGVKNVTVAVYLNNDNRTTYAMAQESTTRTNEERGDDKNSITKEESTKTEPALANNSPLVIEKQAPQVTGVAIVAGGAKNATVKEQISQLVTGLLAIPAHKVIITEGKG